MSSHHLNQSQIAPNPNKITSTLLSSAGFKSSGRKSRSDRTLRYSDSLDPDVAKWLRENELREKMAHRFGKVPVQMTLYLDPPGR
jgi:hypothetical protein